MNAINWDKKAEQFEGLVENTKQLKKGIYDCIVPVSGGKDSTYQILQAKNKHRMKVLAVTFDQFDQTDTGRYNINNLKEIGVDHIHFIITNCSKKIS